MKIPCLVFFGVATAIPLSAQIQSLTPTGGTITGAPFSAIRTTENIQTLADGTHITQPGQKGAMYRDSAGRTRSEFTLSAPPRGGPPAPTGVIISDPVAGFRYQLDSREKVARRFAIQGPRPTGTAQPTPAIALASAAAGLTTSGSGKMAAPLAATGNGAAGIAPKTIFEKLGTQLIEGVAAEGSRATTTWPIGSVGNDREIVVMNETWSSSQLGVVVMTRTVDPRSGDNTMKLTDISLVEPDPALFKPPADYEIKDMGGPTINH